MYSKLQRTAVRCGVGIATVAMVMSSVGVVSAQDDAKYVAMLLPENVNPRWESQDAAFFVEKMAEISPDVTVEVFNANNDTAAQQRQAEQALTEGQTSWSSCPSTVSPRRSSPTWALRPESRCSPMTA